MARNFATFNPNALGPGLALDYGNLVVTTDQINLDGERMVLSTIPKAVGETWINAYFWSNFRGDLTGLCSLGIAEVDSPLDEMVGGASGKSYGLRPTEGNIWHAGAAIDTSGFDGIDERRCIGMQVKFQGTSAGPEVLWFVERTQVARIILPSGKFWCYAASVGNGSQAAGDISCFVFPGGATHAFDFQPPLPVNS